ncbi:MAG: hypothetical protein KatS3mg110_1128 [Pirellulaceae bacterium]|nr:MAG: hypothetical protein KatS3mg110_1128 [Pirellulaceae bacterium]
MCKPGWIVAALLVCRLVSGTWAKGEEAVPDELRPFFQPPAEYENDFGHYRSPLLFDNGTPVTRPEQWPARRQEILRRWHEWLGPWPELIREPKVTYGEQVDEPDYKRYTVQFQLTPLETTTAYLLLPKMPQGRGRRPAVLVVYYEPETAVGLRGMNRDFARQLARRGFVALSVGHDASIYYPSREAAQLQPLSALAYAAANAYYVLASRPDVDPDRIGIVGHSYGGKWAMFAACLFDKFACAAWSDPGIVFDESRPNVNYWEPWYLGYEGPMFRRRGVPSPDNPRTGLYRRLIEEGRDLHELHALMAPRPFLVSGGSEDPPSRWQALNHARQVNRLLGYEFRVAMTNRPGHDPTEESNRQIYLFFEHFLKPHQLRPADSQSGRSAPQLIEKSASGSCTWSTRHLNTDPLFPFIATLGTRQARRARRILLHTTLLTFIWPAAADFGSSFPPCKYSS